MAKVGSSHSPASPEERQAAATLTSAQTVLAEIETISRDLSNGSLSPETKRRRRTDLAEASERLCNLMALAIYQLANGVHGEYRERLRQSVEHLRGRLIGMGTRLMLKKLKQVHDRAAGVLEGGSYPLGLASRLEQAFSGIRGNLETLGAIDRLDEGGQSLVSQTADDIRKLKEMEERLGVLREISGPPPPAPAARKRALPTPRSK